jgi:hypothetical protein
LDNSVVESDSELILPRFYPSILLEIAHVRPPVIPESSEGIRKARCNLILPTQRGHIANAHPHGPAHPIRRDYRDIEIIAKKTIKYSVALSRGQKWYVAEGISSFIMSKTVSGTGLISVVRCAVADVVKRTGRMDGLQAKRWI